LLIGAVVCGLAVDAYVNPEADANQPKQPAVTDTASEECERVSHEDPVISEATVPAADSDEPVDVMEKIEACGDFLFSVTGQKFDEAAMAQRKKFADHLIRSYCIENSKDKEKIRQRIGVGFSRVYGTGREIYFYRPDPNEEPGQLKGPRMVGQKIELKNEPI